MSSVASSQKARGGSVDPIDELEAAPASLAEVYRALNESVQKLPGGLERIDGVAHRLMREFSPAHLAQRPPSPIQRVGFDPLPRIVAPEDWQQISSGIAQRISIWNHFFRDIYDTEECLKAGIVPFELVYDDPRYQRPAVGVSVPKDTYVHVAAFDLVRNSDGKWVVINDDVSLANGAGYALQCRQVLSQVAPELLSGHQIHTSGKYPVAFLEHLQTFAPTSASESRVILLCPNNYDLNSVEQTFLARQTGVPFVRCSDLIVLNTRVYLKTIGGLEPIDVIYRRFSDQSIDPLGLSQSNQDGVPGLMSCVRKGTVTIANAIGTGLGNNQAIASYLPKLARFYLGQSIELPSIRRLLCFDPDQCEEVLAAPWKYVIRSITDPANAQAWHPRSMGEWALSELSQRVSANPASYVAEQQLPANILPSTYPGETDQPFGLRVFAFGGAPAQVFPLALTATTTQPGSGILESGLQGRVKDTWIVRDPKESEEPRPIRVATPQRRLRLGSRIADSYFWIGRYAERSETTTRILRIVQRTQLEDPAHYDARGWNTLWESLARATGHPTHFFKRNPLPDRQTISHYLMFNRENPSSVASCIDRCRENALNISESVPPEVWGIINRTHQVISDADPSPHARSALGEPYGSWELQENLMEKLDALSGAAMKHMLRDGGWHFWNLGVHIERAITTILVTRQFFLKRPGTDPEPQKKHPDLEPLLQMLSCLYAYRSLFQTRPSAENAVSLVLQDEHLPHSLLYCLKGINEALVTAFGDQSRERKRTPAKDCQKLHAKVAFKDLSPFFTPSQRGRQPSFSHWLDEIAADVNKLASVISDHYLHHQAINVIR